MATAPPAMDSPERPSKSNEQPAATSQERRVSLQESIPRDAATDKSPGVPPSPSASSASEASGQGAAEPQPPIMFYGILENLEDPPSDEEDGQQPSTPSVETEHGKDDEKTKTTPWKLPAEIVQRKTYASFGDSGTTASVNAFGKIMQISRFLDNANSGFYCLDTRDMDEPYNVQWRMDSLAELVADDTGGVGIIIKEDITEDECLTSDPPTLEYVHHRWPRFKTQSLGRDLKIQYYCTDGTIFQQYTWTLNKQSNKFPFSQVTFDRKLLIRDLDFHNESNRFNEASYKEPEYIPFLPTHKKSLIITHKLPSEAESKDSKEYQEEPQQPQQPQQQTNRPRSEEAQPHVAVCLVLTAFVNGIPAEIMETETDPDIYEIIVDDKAKNRSNKSGRLKITMAYRLQTARAQEHVSVSIVPTSDLKKMNSAFRSESQETVSNLKFSSNEHLDFALKRNLEHILSVCSIPLQPHSGVERVGREEVVPYVLTCGDMSGHRITGASSFFAFQFLLSVLKFIDSEDARECHFTPGTCASMGHSKGCQNHPEKCKTILPSVEWLKERIISTCRGHVKWICERAKPEKNIGFSPHYWATGEIIPDTPWNRLPSWTDSPLQILKVSEFSNHPKNGGDLALKELLQKINPWQKSLIDQNKRGKYVFPREYISDQDSKLPRYEIEYQGSVSPRTPDSLLVPDEADKIYYLSDHAWICCAVQGVEKLWEKLNPSKSDSIDNQITTDAEIKNDSDPNHGRCSEWRKNYSFAETKRIIVKRFTLENPFSSQRMLATSRTPTETRFLFYPRDTALLHASTTVFADGVKQASAKPGKDGARENSRKKQNHSIDQDWKYLLDVWNHSLDAQKSYDEYQDLDWTEPMWYVLVLIMSSRGKHVNGMETDKAFDAALHALLGSSSSNGLFPGLLNDANEPTFFEYEMKRDEYWDATFEIPFVLWNYARDVGEAGLAPKKGSGTSLGANRPDSATRSDAKSNTDRTDTLQTPEPFERWLRHIESKFSTSSKDAGRTGQIIDKTVPFENFLNLIDRKVLVEIWDDWLQDGPAALAFGVRPDLDDSLLGKFTEKELNQFLSGGMKQFRLTKNSECLDGLLSGENPVINHTHHRQSLCTDGIDRILEDRFDKASNSSTGGLIIDIPKHSQGNEIDTCKQSNAQIARTLRSTRTALNAKKRLVWLPGTDVTKALLCCSAAPKLERPRLSAFFVRHAKYEKYAFDTTAAALNEWETELHLSYYKLEKSIESKDDSVSAKIASPTSVTFNKVTLVRKVKSFRFIGDFFDRNWTCYFLENEREADADSIRSRLPRLSDVQRDIQRPEAKVKSENNDQEQPRKVKGEERPWQQRRVLELLLFYEILEDMEVATSKICHEAQASILDRGKTSAESPEIEIPHLFKLSRDGPRDSLSDSLFNGAQLIREAGKSSYNSITRRWRFFEQLLQALEDDLDENLETISEWNNREKDRELQRPRWTKNDEKRYRPAIIKLSVLCQKKTRELERLRSNLEAFRGSLSSRLDSTREDMSFRGSENMNLFTYVTVVFLPLGFATGIFSMSEAPASRVLEGMIITALATLLVTVLALMNARVAVSVLSKVSKIVAYSTLFLIWPVSKFLTIYAFNPLAHLFENWAFMEFLNSQLEHLKETPRIKKLQEKKHNAEDCKRKAEAQSSSNHIQTQGVAPSPYVDRKGDKDEKKHRSSQEGPQDTTTPADSGKLRGSSIAGERRGTFPRNLSTPPRADDKV
ncbi:hypothetical protein B0J12DRAFT_752023 [Macrophomina phaseolina]|uniref:Mg2+ transporter protein CorA-like/Zinc transport protein ZntB n=1 Tax=Macrophomina phaseolina TaxID=35725 RepID=A0ABQ8GGA8_9PEZI|nr:hypothetical protein B0J12DRAFT_752023 [Macrophomina phaseolina]